MPSDPRTQSAIALLEPSIRQFRAALAATAQEMDRLLEHHQSTASDRASRVRAELGPFAAHRTDVAWLADLLEPGAAGEAFAEDTVRRCRAVLTDLIEQGEALFFLTLPTGTSLYDAVAQRLAHIGRSFATARVVRGTRSATAASLGGLPFGEWNRKDRELAPPVMVELHGSDLRGAGLADFLDGRVKIVLVAAGETSPAPLARVIAPRTFVLQTSDTTGLDRFAAWEGPGVAAIVPESAARFVHDPAAGRAPWERLTVHFTPPHAPRRAVAGLSVAQQADELALLSSLAMPPGAGVAGPPEPPAPVVPADPVDRLAAWLLSQADLETPA